MKQFTRQQYLNSECTHSEYYGQFVTNDIKSVVESKFSAKKLKNAIAENDSFNTIPLAQWNAIVPFIFSTPGKGAEMRQLGDYPTQAGGVCIAKEAARQIATQ